MPMIQSAAQLSAMMQIAAAIDPDVSDAEMRHLATTGMLARLDTDGDFHPFGQRVSLTCAHGVLRVRDEAGRKLKEGVDYEVVDGDRAIKLLRGVEGLVVDYVRDIAAEKRAYSDAVKRRRRSPVPPTASPDAADKRRARQRAQKRARKATRRHG
ncbi:hypothetical protein [Salinarimonas rosea]|uniref:hypothetical protein n=1 Tax=Salinarimonas rosea TaxID=552063 RepID=UPI0003FAAFFC|nr:hypothetical protein [Salinarimonas rosea]